MTILLKRNLAQVVGLFVLKHFFFLYSMLRFLRSFPSVVPRTLKESLLYRQFSAMTANGLDLSFVLDESFVNKYKNIQPPFGYAPLGELVYRRTYSRTLPDGSKEDWWQTVRRVVEGTYSLQKEHIRSFHLGWDDEHGQRSAQEMYDLIFNMKFLPPGMCQ